MRLATLALCPILSLPLAAQSSNRPATTTQPQPHRAHTKKHPVKQASALATPVAPVQPAAPPPPDWPANDKAQPPSVAWNGRDLTIAAANSSLDQILHEVSTATGLKVEGYQSASGSSDQRIYGSYGPASARVVLGQLLDGSGYNVIMVGDRGAGTPRELLLTSQAKAAQPGAAHPAAQQNNEDEPAEEPEPAPVENQPPTALPPGVRTPQQMRQELMQRQQQQQLPNMPPETPPQNPPPTAPND